MTALTPATLAAEIAFTRRKPPRVRKYLKGLPLTLQELCTELRANNYVFLHNRPCNPGWLRSMQFNVLDNMCRSNFLFKAALNPEWVSQELENVDV